MTALTCATLLAELRRQKVRVELDGTSIRVSAPKGVVSNDHRDVLMFHKPELVERLRLESTLVNMTFPEFSKQHYSIELRVDWFDETIWIVPTTSAADELIREGICRGRIWTAAELIDLHSIDRLPKTEARGIALLKAEFGLDILSVSDGADDPPIRSTRCYWCRGTRFWVSMFGDSTCGTCHPPANPSLVGRWIESDEASQ